jgi:hypothetical protein
MCVHTLLCMFFGFNIPKWNPCFITCCSKIWLWNILPSLWYCCKKSQIWRKPFSVFCSQLWAFSEHATYKICARLACINFVRMLQEICRNSPMSSEVVKDCLSRIHKTLTRSLTRDGRPLCSSVWTIVCLAILQYSTPFSYSSSTHSNMLINHMPIIRNGFLQHLYF